MDAEMNEILERVKEKAAGCEESTPVSEKPLSLEAREKRAVEAGAKKRFAKAVLSDFEPKTIGSCHHFLSEEGQGLFIHGPAGTGKTHLAVAVMKEAMSNKRPDEWSNVAGSAYLPLERFITIPWLLMEIRASFKDTAADSEYDLIRRHSSVPLLVLDDLGAEKGSEFAVQTLYLIVDRRYSMMRKTIITSNLSIGEVAERLGDRIASRITGMCKIIELKGKDRRLNGT